MICDIMQPFKSKLHQRSRHEIMRNSTHITEYNKQSVQSVPNQRQQSIPQDYFNKRLNTKESNKSPFQQSINAPQSLPYHGRNKS